VSDVPTTQDKEQKSDISYSYTLSVEGIAKADRDAFSSSLINWHIGSSDDRLFLYPYDRKDGEGSLSDYLRTVFQNDGSILQRAAAIASGEREISVGIYYNPDKIAAICPTIDADVMRQLADLNFALELCVFPCGDEDNEK
jgi:hypothetical protein